MEAGRNSWRSSVSTVFSRWASFARTASSCLSLEVTIVAVLWVGFVLTASGMLRRAPERTEIEVTVRRG